MPWKEDSVEDQKIRFIADAQHPDACFSSVCRAYGISRVSGYKWLHRYQAEGIDGLHERSRDTHKHRQEWDESIRAEALDIRRYKGNWGGVKIRNLMKQRNPDRPLPGHATIDRWIKDADLVIPPRRRQKVDNSKGGPVGKTSQPNEIWCADFKGEFRLQNGKLCYPLTVTDAYSRYLLGCFALPGTFIKQSTQCFQKLFKNYGIPQCLHTDNGSPFAGSCIGNHSSLSVFWLQLGIKVDRSRMGKPQDNASHERMHRTLKRDTTRPPQKTMAQQQQCFDRFQYTYNYERSHEGINHLVPADLYVPSNTKLPTTLQPFTYPGYFEVRKVSSNGCISFGHPRMDILIGGAYIGLQVGLQSFDEYKWRVYLGNMELGILDERRGALYGYAANIRPPDRRLRSFR